MFHKIIICILFLLINSTLEYTPMKLEKYGSITVSTRGYFYLSLDGFNLVIPFILKDHLLVMINLLILQYIFVKPMY